MKVIINDKGRRKTMNLSMEELQEYILTREEGNREVDMEVIIRENRDDE